MSASEGLKCPSCGSHRLQVKDTRPMKGTNRRIRRCFDCKGKFQTIEVVSMPARVRGIPKQDAA